VTRRRAARKRSVAGIAPSESTTRLWNRMNAQWICATARFSSFRGSGMIAFRFAATV